MGGVGQNAVLAVGSRGGDRVEQALTASLLGEFEAYLSRQGADPTAGMVTYRQIPLWLDDTEKEALYEDFVAAIRTRLGHKPSPDRRRHLLGMIMFPTHADPDP